VAVKGLSPRQVLVCQAIEQHIADAGYPPTLRELGSALAIRSTNGVNDHLRALERKGLLKRDGMKSRGLVLSPSWRAYAEAR
jgi:repressor LexA